MSTVSDAERYARQLSGTVLFKGEPEDQIRQWLTHANVMIAEYDAGEYLFRKSDTTDRIGILLRGSAEVNRESSDGSMHMSTLKRNDLFGAASICGRNESYVTDIRCKERTRVLIIPEKEMLDLLSENRTVLQNYLHYLNGRIRFLNQRLDAFSKNSVSARVMTLFSAEAEGRIYTVKSYTKLSESLCVSRATLYRALNTLEEEHKIRRNGKEIELMEDYQS
mgnify:CR=1 FL=1